MKVVSISGAGRSGGTFLSLLLSQAPGAVNLGSVHDLWRAFAQDRNCSCGAVLRDCPIHGRAVAAAVARFNNGGVEALADRARAFQRAAEALEDWGDPTKRARLRRDHAGFLQSLSAALQAVQTQTEAHTIIDRSGAPAMALAYDLLDNVDVRVLHLIRDPRAVVSNGDDDAGGLGAKLIQLQQWRRRQRRLDRWRHGLGARYMALHYEDLVSRPRDVLATTLQWAGLQPAPGLFLRADTVRLDWSCQHLYPPANGQLLSMRTETYRISPDDAAPIRSARWLQMLATAFTWREMRRHYPRNET